MKIVEKLSCINTMINMIDFTLIFISVILFIPIIALKKTLLTIIIFIFIIFLIILIHFFVYNIYKFIKSKYYIINNDNISEYVDGKLVNYYSFYNFSNIVVFRLIPFISGNDYTHIEFYCKNEKYIIYMSYRQAKKVIKIYLEFKEKMAELIKK